VAFLSAEWLVSPKGCGLANGGATITARAVWTTSLIYGGLLGISNMIDPTRTWEFDSVELRVQLLGSFSWFGAVFAATYTALYARFSSQFTYLANLYNQIKSAECGAPPSETLPQWKAGFIEDAEVLHLAHKPIFASVISAWANDSKVRDEYGEHVPGGSARLATVMVRVNRSLERTRKRYATTK